jgi:hypothetical protein
VIVILCMVFFYVRANAKISANFTVCSHLHMAHSRPTAQPWASLVCRMYDVHLLRRTLQKTSLKLSLCVLGEIPKC